MSLCLVFLSEVIGCMVLQEIGMSFPGGDSISIEGDYQKFAGAVSALA